MVASNLFFLLRTAFWTKSSCLPTMNEEEWQEILKISKEQTVIGNLADAITTLPIELRPPAKVMQQLVPLVLHIERQHYRMEQTLVDLFKALNQINVRPILMKGQSVGRRYPHPEHRICGDIDLLFKSDEDLKRANEWARQHAEWTDDFYEKHLAFRWKGVVVEHHAHLSSLASRRYDHCWKEIVAAELSTGTLPEIHFGEVTTYELPSTLYAFFLLLHKCEHVMEDGLGLRQVCDWAIFLQSESSRIDREKFQKWLDLLELRPLANAFGQIVVDDIGMSEECLPFPLVRNQKHYQLLLKDIFKGGNFGKKRYPYKGRVGKLYDMWRTLWVKLPRYTHLYQLWPREARARYSSMFRRGIKRLKIALLDRRRRQNPL